jgi:polar amino acid transport system permease protein
MLRIQARKHDQRAPAAGTAEDRALWTDDDVARWSAIPRKPGRRVGLWWEAVVVLLLLGFLIKAFATNQTIEWSMVGHYLFLNQVTSGVRVTLLLTLICLGAGLVLGLVIASMRLSRNPVLSTLSQGYIWIFRSTPPLVQILFWYNLGAAWPRLMLRIPLIHLTLFNVRTDSIMKAFTAAVIAISLSEGAYMSEIIRGGILSVHHGQREAALAVGMTNAQAMRQVILPQAVRVIIPALGNQFIHLVKTTTLVAFIALSDLLFSVQQIFDQNFQVIPLLTVATIWYLAIIGVATIAQMALERWLAN